MPLTDTALRALKPASQPYKVTDEKGLYVLVSPTGARQWRIDYRFPRTRRGKRKTLSLSIYPQVTLSDTRKRRDETRTCLMKDIDPALKQRRERNALIHSLETTFEGIARDWLKKKKADWSEGHYAKTCSRLEKHVFPWIGDLPIRDIRVADIRPFPDRLATHGKVQTAHRMRGTISRVFKFAMVADEADRDPAAALVEVLPERQETRHPTITDPAKVGQLLLDIDGYHGTEVIRSLLKLAPMVFARPGELRTALWSEIDWDHP